MVYANQRIMYYQIKDFLEHGHPSCRIGVLTGTRRIGKTGILTDLAESLPNSTYVNMDPKADQQAERKKLAEALNKGEGYLFIDEVTHYKWYESLLESLLFGVYNKYPHMKVIISGSSMHLFLLHYGSLGGGRSKLFRLSFLSFAEYLNFTGRVSGYIFKPCSTITGQDFKDYLNLKGLERTGLGLIFDETYVKAIFQNLYQSNRCARSPGNIANYTQHDLMCILDVIAHSLSNHTKWSSNLSIGFVGNIEDRHNLRILLTEEQVEKMEAASVAKALLFLLETNLAYAEIRFEENRRKSANELAHILLHSKTSSHLKEALSEYNICLKNPLWYTNLAEKKLKNHQIDLTDLFSSKVLGLIIENYIKGSYCDLGWDLNYQICNIGAPSRNVTNNQRLYVKEVPLFDQRNQVLCEITAGSEGNREVHLMAHCKNIECIRIEVTDESEEYSMGIHKIPYPKVCAMVDTGEVLNLERSVSSIFEKKLQ